MLKGRFFGEYQSIQITTGSNVIAESDSLAEELHEKWGRKYLKFSHKILLWITSQYQKRLFWLSFY
jgi:hypothetical protein